MRIKNVVCFAFCFCFLWTACRKNEKINAPDVSDIKVELSIKRFEQDLFSIDTNQVSTGLEILKSKYPDFSAIFFNQILGLEKLPKEEHENFVKGFLKHPPLRQLYDTCTIVYPKLDDIEEEFEQAFRFLKYYFPEKRVPEITSFISEYSYAAFIYKDDALATGLDFFLGEDYPYLKYNQGETSFSDYITRTFNKDHLVSKTIQPMIEDMCGAPEGDRLLDFMIYNGKKHYLLNLLLPHTADTVIMEVSQEQLNWLEENELEMWKFLLQEELIYSSEWHKIRKYVDYSPHSPGMPPEAPGRTANWIGWNIVKSYMRRNPETSLSELIAFSNAQEFLEKSMYKPRR